MPEKPIVKVLETHNSRLTAIPGVVGVAEGESHGKPCIKIYVVEKKQSLLRQIPASLDGYPVEVVESGIIEAR